MNFSDLLKDARKNKGLSQKELALLSGVSYRTIQNWESGLRRPSTMLSVGKVATILGVSSAELLGETDNYLIDAYERGGTKKKKDIELLINEVSGLFAGGDLDEDEKAGVIAALNQAYWIATEKNKKYGRKKIRDNPSEVGFE